MKDKTPKLAEIAARIQDHLKSMETSQPIIEGVPRQFWHTAAWAAGSKVGLHYISYQLAYKLTKDEALAYLRWLDAGNFGKHSLARLTGYATTNEKPPGAE